MQNNIVVEVENINSFTYNALVKDQQIINNAFSKILDYNCLVALKKPKADNKVKAEQKKQPLLDPSEKQKNTEIRCPKSARSRLID